ncbi:dihydroneopterin triphosphate diphosphatase [Ningiella sp. W23]|uniref:dihydroneopterin triphosphate diphosphatase n=1 Tax=Ningiella sp. W23 TaxID=3023715 RepID=UPI003757F761
MTFKLPESVMVVLHTKVQTSNCAQESAENSQVLLLQRMDDPDFWQSVTGTMEPGESPIQTAYREVAEETGIELSFSNHDIVDCRLVNQYQIRKQWRYRYAPGTSFNNEHVFCACVDINTQVKLTEHLSYAWMSKEQAMAKAWSSTNRRAIEMFVP